MADASGRLSLVVVQWYVCIHVPRGAIATNAGTDDRSETQGETDEQDQRQQVCCPREHSDCDTSDTKNGGGRLYPWSSGTVPCDPGLR